MASLSRRDLFVLALLTLFWGVNWPVMKFAVREYPPLTFRFLCMAGGVAAMAAYMAARGISFRVPPGQRVRVALLAIPNMVVWHLLVIYAVKFLSSGRAAIIGYTMPVWTLLIGVLVYRERVALRQWAGVGAALLGIILLLSSELTSMAGKPVGVVLILIAAASWGWGAHLIRRMPVDVPTSTLTLWMLLLGTLANLVAAVAFETGDWRMPSAGEWAAILYNAVIVFGFCHIAYFHLVRVLTPVATGLSMMMIPVVGVFSGMWALGEVPHWQDYAALVLILFSLASVLLGRARPPQVA